MVAEHPEAMLSYGAVHSELGEGCGRECRGREAQCQGKSFHCGALVGRDLWASSLSVVGVREGATRPGTLGWWRLEP